MAKDLLAAITHSERDFADMGDWSPPQPIPNSDEIIRVQIRRFGRSG